MTAGIGNDPAAPNSAAPSASQPAAPAVQPGMVLTVVEENHSFEQVIGNPNMPYLNGLAQQGALATQYYANMHHSLPNYFALTTGETQVPDDSYAGPLSADNIVRALASAGKTWKAYVEDLPSPGYLGSDVGSYIKHHNPFAYFNDVVNNPAQAGNIVPFAQLSADVGSGALPSFSFIVPNRLNDAHDCGTTATCNDSDVLARADQWLKTNIDPVLGSSQFKRGGLLFIVFDESTITDIRNGGGRVPLIAVGPKAKPGAQSSATYNHVNTLRTVCEVLSVSSCPGSAASAAAEDDLIQH